MNLVFMNSMEKEVETGRFQTAAVTIVEDKGKHQIHWQEPDHEGGHRDELWFEGDNWEELLVTFQFRLTEKMAEGYTPVIEKLPQRPDQLSEQALRVQMLYYYSEHQTNESLFEALRSWRRERAVKDGKAPYLIASNRLLRVISTFIPHTRDELMQIPGFGQNKWDAYGKEIMEITQEVEQPRPFPLNWVNGTVNHEDFMTWLYTQQEMKFRSEVDQITRNKRLKQLIDSGASLKEVEKEIGMSSRDILLLLERLIQNGHDLSKWVKKELECVDESECKKVLETYKTKGDKYLKPVLEELYPEKESYHKSELDNLYLKLRLIRLHYRMEQQVQLRGQAG